MARSKIRWGDTLDDEDALPSTTVRGPDNNGVKVTTGVLCVLGWVCWVELWLCCVCCVLGWPVRCMGRCSVCEAAVCGKSTGR